MVFQEQRKAASHHLGDEGEPAWNDPKIDIGHSEITDSYQGSVPVQRYAIADVMLPHLREKD